MIAFRTMILIAAAPLLAGCNTTPAPTARVQPAATAAPASPFPVVVMPEGSGCSAVIGRYQAVLKADLETGNVNKSVYDRIQGELAPANSACAAGRDGEARSIVAASKSRHGYPG
ncbi:MAG: hypothetical protein K2X62_05075 [Beijerinckiaceae bacterium]|nr:hypothetical protein [Beijerinckiaceae bacterium]MDO9440298.1 hypothetical protein [Beijerinckiaceae bacterium]